MVLLATVATVIASQAVISGAFSVTSRQVQSLWCPAQSPGLRLQDSQPAALQATF
jgi:hypothetical protein